MGAGSPILRALTAAALAAVVASCIDFVAPDLPELGAPAVFDAALRVQENGSVQIDARLSPGLTDDGLRRQVTRPAVRVLDRDVEPRSGGLDGRRSYFEEWRTTRDSVAGTLSIEAPAVAGVGSPPALRWPGIRKLDGDTVFLTSEQDLVLHVHTAADDAPAPLNRSWLLQLDGFESSFVIGARGVPPETLAIERRWLPAPLGGSISAVLSYSRSVSVRPENANYIGVLLVDSRVAWTVVPAAAAGSARR